jgi:phenylpyruvate tautomerase PptA (4-oxalocrotonate tautomerase family)
VEENVFVRVLGFDETVTAGVVEEIDRTSWHCERTDVLAGYKASVGSEHIRR